MYVDYFYLYLFLIIKYNYKQSNIDTVIQQLFITTTLVSDSLLNKEHRVTCDVDMQPKSAATLSTYSASAFMNKTSATILVLSLTVF